MAEAVSHKVPDSRSLSSSPSLDQKKVTLRAQLTLQQLKLRSLGITDTKGITMEKLNDQEVRNAITEVAQLTAALKQLCYNRIRPSDDSKTHSNISSNRSSTSSLDFQFYPVETSSIDRHGKLTPTTSFMGHSRGHSLPLRRPSQSKDYWRSGRDIPIERVNVERKMKEEEILIPVKSEEEKLQELMEKARDLSISVQDGMLSKDMATSGQTNRGFLVKPDPVIRCVKVNYVDEMGKSESTGHHSGCHMPQDAMQERPSMQTSVQHGGDYTSSEYIRPENASQRKSSQTSMDIINEGVPARQINTSGEKFTRFNEGFTSETSQTVQDGLEQNKIQNAISSDTKLRHENYFQLPKQMKYDKADVSNTYKIPVEQENGILRQEIENWVEKSKRENENINSSIVLSEQEVEIYNSSLTNDLNTPRSSTSTVFVSESNISKETSVLEPELPPKVILPGSIDTPLGIFKSDSYSSNIESAAVVAAEATTKTTTTITATTTTTSKNSEFILASDSDKNSSGISSEFASASNITPSSSIHSETRSSFSYSRFSQPKYFEGGIKPSNYSEATQPSPSSKSSQFSSSSNYFTTLHPSQTTRSSDVSQASTSYKVVRGNDSWKATTVLSSSEPASAVSSSKTILPVKYSEILPSSKIIAPLKYPDVLPESQFSEIIPAPEVFRDSFSSKIITVSPETKPDTNLKRKPPVIPPRVSSVAVPNVSSKKTPPAIPRRAETTVLTTSPGAEISFTNPFLNRTASDESCEININVPQVSEVSAVGAEDTNGIANNSKIVNCDGSAGFEFDENLKLRTNEPSAEVEFITNTFGDFWSTSPMNLSEEFDTESSMVDNSTGSKNTSTEDNTASMGSFGPGINRGVDLLSNSSFGQTNNLEIGSLPNSSFDSKSNNVNDYNVKVGPVLSSLQNKISNVNDNDVKVTPVFSSFLISSEPTSLATLRSQASVEFEEIMPEVEDDFVDQNRNFIPSTTAHMNQWEYSLGQNETELVNSVVLPQLNSISRNQNLKSSALSSRQLVEENELQSQSYMPLAANSDFATNNVVDESLESDILVLSARPLGNNIDSILSQKQKLLQSSNKVNGNLSDHNIACDESNTVISYAETLNKGSQARALEASGDANNYKENANVNNNENQNINLNKHHNSIENENGNYTEEKPYIPRKLKSPEPVTKHKDKFEDISKFARRIFVAVGSPRKFRRRCDTPPPKLSPSENIEKSNTCGPEVGTFGISQDENCNMEEILVIEENGLNNNQFINSGENQFLNSGETCMEFSSPSSSSLSSSSASSPLSPNSLSLSSLPLDNTSPTSPNLISPSPLSPNLTSPSPLSRNTISPSLVSSNVISPSPQSPIPVSPLIIPSTSAIVRPSPSLVSPSFPTFTTLFSSSKSLVSPATTITISASNSAASGTLASVPKQPTVIENSPSEVSVEIASPYSSITSSSSSSSITSSIAVYSSTSTQPLSHPISSAPASSLVKSATQTAPLQIPHSPLSVTVPYRASGMMSLLFKPSQVKTPQKPDTTEISQKQAFPLVAPSVTTANSKLSDELVTIHSGVSSQKDITIPTKQASPEIVSTDISKNTEASEPMPNFIFRPRYKKARDGYLGRASYAIDPTQGETDEFDSGNAGLSPTTKNKKRKGDKRSVTFDPLSLLLNASLEGDLDLVMSVIGKVGNPNQCIGNKFTALHTAICNSNTQVAKFLIEYGCDANAKDMDGWTPLHCAASSCNIELVDLLIKKGASLHATTLTDRETALQKCSKYPLPNSLRHQCVNIITESCQALGRDSDGLVYAVWSYDAENDDEVDLCEGDRVKVISKSPCSARLNLETSETTPQGLEEGWWVVRKGEKEGFVPRTHLALYPRTEPLWKTTSSSQSLDEQDL